MYPLIIYIVHAATCAIFTIMLLAYHPAGSRNDDRYSAVKHAFAFICGIQVPVDGVFAWLFAERISDAFLYEFTIPMLCATMTVLIFYIFSLLIHIPQLLVRWYYTAFAILMVLLLLHPMSYVLYTRQNNMDYTIMAYLEFCHTPFCRITLIVLYVFTGTFVAFSLYNILVIRIFLNRMFNSNNNRRITNYSYVILAILIQFMVTVRAFPHNGYYEYHVFWIIMDTIGVMYTFNQRTLFVQMERQSRVLQLDMINFFRNAFGLSFLLDANTVKTKSRELQTREVEAIRRAVKNWSERIDKPYMKENLTMTDLSLDIGIPVPILMNCSRYVFGCDFNEYIAMLREKVE